MCQSELSYSNMRRKKPSAKNTFSQRANQQPIRVGILSCNIRLEYVVAVSTRRVMTRPDSIGTRGSYSAI